MNQLTLGSLFDGIGGFPLAGIKSGITPVWASEIEPFPVRVTEKRLPGMKHYGDVSKLIGGDLEPVNIITFGSPCQDLSIAGKRNGLDGARSGLFREAIRIITEMRCKTHGRYPRWAVWENVPGALSSADGRDFREVLESLIRIKAPEADVPMPDSSRWLPAGEIMGDDYSLAWRILDASKGWGVAQRRKRIFAVLDLDGQCAGKVLFESEGLSGYTPPRCETRQGTARDVEEGFGEAGSSEGGALAPTRASVPQDKPPVPATRLQARGQVICLNDQGGSRMDVTREMTSTLRAEAHHPPCIMGASGFCTEHSADSRSIGYREEESPTLRAGVTPGVAIEFNPTDSRIRIKDDGICQTLCSRMGTGGNCVPLTFSLPYCKGTRPHIAAIVTQYLLAADVDMSKVTDAQVDAMVNAYAEAANCDKSALKAEAVAQITEYVQAEGLKPPIITAKVQITGYDYLTYRDFQKNSGLNVEVPVRLGEVDEDELRRSATAESSGSGRTALKSPSPLCPKGRSLRIPSPPWTRTAHCIS